MKKIYILGLGCGGEHDITLRTLECLKKCDKVFVRTEIHPSIGVLREYGINYETFDGLYATQESFEDVYSKIAQSVINAEGDETAYVVPGSAVFAEKSVVMILSQAECEVEIIPAVSFIDGVFSMLKCDAASSFKLTDALRLDTQKPDTGCINLICQIYDKSIASDTKLELMKYYDENTEVYLITAASAEDASCEKMKLYEIDRSDKINHLTSLVIPAQDYDTTLSSFDSAEKVVGILRSENGCPWDKAQTHESLTPYVVEEAYEVVDAINRGDSENLCEELGDLLLQVLLHAQIAAEEENFNMSDIIYGLNRKLIRRHPHVFGDTKAPDDLYKMWDEVKKTEHDYESFAEEMNSVPKSFPALTYAEKIQKKAAKAGFDFKGPLEASDKITEELLEFKQALGENDERAASEEAGDLLFAVCNTLRLAGINAEEALKAASEKFIGRFAETEKLMKRDGLNISEEAVEISDLYWEKAKKKI